MLEELHMLIDLPVDVDRERCLNVERQVIDEIVDTVDFSLVVELNVLFGPCVERLRELVLLKELV